MRKRELSKMNFFDPFTRALWIVLSVFLFGFYTSALDRDRTIDQFYHTAWTARDGAPSQITALAQTEDGYLWIGSSLGLYRFDGVKFEQFSPPNQAKLPSYNIYALLATPDNGLWISFRPSGLGFLKDGQLKIYTKPEELPTAQVYCFARTPDGSIWAGTHNGLAKFNGSGWTEIGEDWNFKPERIRALFADKKGSLWVSTENSVSFLPANSNKFASSQSRKRVVLQFNQAADGKLWTASYYPDGKNKVFFEAEPPDKTFDVEVNTDQVLFDRDGSLWMTNIQYGLTRLSNPEQIYHSKGRSRPPELQVFDQKNGLSGDVTTTLLEDREGNIWVGTINGLDRFRQSAIAPIKLPDNFKRMTLVSADKGEIWAGSALEESILRIGKNIKEINVKESQISSFFRQGESIWWGGFGGIFRQQGEEVKYFSKPDDLKIDFIWEVIRGKEKDGFWINYGDEGLLYFKDGIWTRRASPTGLPNRGPSASFHDSSGRIWLGYTENRIFLLNGNEARGYTKENGVEIGRIKVIRGRGDQLWAGGELGLAFYQDDRFHTIKTTNEQFGAVSGIILTADGDVWLNESHGIVKIPATEIARLKENPQYPVNYRLFDFQDNLPGGPQMNFTVSTAVEASDGKLWFATDAGLAQIDPTNIPRNAVSPPVLIKSVTADDRTFETFSELNFPAGTESLRINYTALSLSIPERVQFKYQLENFDNHWNDAENRREAFYTNLGPGKYRFQVIAANNDGLWNEHGASLEFEILPRFYQTNSFLFLCIGAVVFAAWLIYKWRVYAVESRLNMQFEERLFERTRIAQDLHDTLLQGIVGISMQIDVAVEHLPDALPAKTRFDRIRELMTQLIKEGRNTVNGLRLVRSDGDPVILEDELAEISHHLNAREKVSFRITTVGTPIIFHPAVYDEVFHICREAVVNAFRHSKAAVIEVNLEYSAKVVKIWIQDDGIGIDPKILEQGRKGHWGLSGMKTRANAIGAKLKISSQIGAGTKLELVISNETAFKTKGRDLANKLFGTKISISRQSKNEFTND